MKELLLAFAEYITHKTRQLVPTSANCHKTQSNELLLATVRQKVSKEIRGAVSGLNITRGKSVNYNENEIIRAGLFQGYTLSSINQTLFNKCNSRRDHNLKKGKSAVEIFENNVKNIMKARVGNCYEVSDVAIMLCHESKDFPGITVEKYSLSGAYDHCFVVLNRPANSDPFDMRTWGNEAVICDPWCHSTFDVSALLQEDQDSWPPMFLYIYNGLTFNSSKNVEYSTRVGNGHSQHWNTKYASALVHDLPECKDLPSVLSI